MDNSSQKQIDCTNVIMSQDYADFLIVYEGDLDILNKLDPVCINIINKRFAVIHKKIDPLKPVTFENYDLSIIPELFSPLDTSHLDSSGITQVHNQPFLQLRGSGVIIGLVDTGIDYAHPVFRYEDNTTKVISIWDQTIQGTPPSTYQYGTEYKKEQINEALKASNPFSIVPSKDENGHGTYLAGLAAGREDIKNDFIGAAPDADIIMVKLKPAKNYLRDLYLVNTGTETYQDTDIMLGIKYLASKALELKRPMAIIVGLGSNFGDHTGTAPLEQYLTEIGVQTGVGVIVACGNEANLGHHFLGYIDPKKNFEDVEIKVGKDESGFILQLWGRAPDTFSVALQSPGGEFIPEIPPRLNQKQLFTFLLEKTQVYVEYKILEQRTGDQLILLRFKDPTPGIWIVKVFSKVNVSGVYNMWLPREGWINPDTFFIRSNPDTTLTIPSTAFIPLTIAAYNHKTDSIYINSSRGYTRDGVIKPNIAAPGVNITGPLPNNSYGSKTGTSVAAAITAGAAALLLEWGIIMGNDKRMDAQKIKYLLVKGATRKPGTVYPNKEWGYGALNLLGTFESLK